MDIEKVGEKLGTKRQWLKEFLSEFAGTFILVFVGSCCVAQKVLRWDVGCAITAMTGYGFAVLLGVLISGPSGSHLNPVVTVAFCVIGKKPWKDCLHYFPAQYLGAFIGAAFAYLVYLGILMFLLYVRWDLLKTFAQEYISKSEHWTMRCFIQF